MAATEVRGYGCALREFASDESSDVTLETARLQIARAANTTKKRSFVTMFESLPRSRLYRYRLAACRKESGGKDSAAADMPCCTVGHRRIRRGTSGDASYDPHRSVPRTKQVSVSLNISMGGGSLVAGSV